MVKITTVILTSACKEEVRILGNWPPLEFEEEERAYPNTSLPWKDLTQGLFSRLVAINQPKYCQGLWCYQTFLFFSAAGLESLRPGISQSSIRGHIFHFNTTKAEYIDSLSQSSKTQHKIILNVGLTLSRLHWHSTDHPSFNTTRKVSKPFRWTARN